MIVIGFQCKSTWQLIWLKRGFRHCFAYRAVGGGWVACDPLGHGLELEVAGAVPLRDLLVSLAAIGGSVVACRIARSQGALPWLRPFTCVEFCKRLARCAGRGIVTPRQLFCHLLQVPRKA